MRLLSIGVLLIMLTACQQTTEFSEEDIRKEIGNVFDDFYEKYESEDFAFTDYYDEDVIRLAPSGKYTEGVEEFKKNWKRTIEEDSFELLSFGEPRFVISREQVVSFNTFDEIFVESETEDTTRYTGTWIAVWQKQQEGDWKIQMTTWHSETE